MHEGEELGYSVFHAFRTVFDDPDTITLTMVEDVEAETSSLVISWHSIKYLNFINDNAALSVLHLNE